jgi:hypothetical protein
MVRITERTFHDLKDTGFAVLFDPAVVTETTLADFRDQFWNERERAFFGRATINPFTGEPMAAQHDEPPPEHPWMLTVARRVAEPFVGRGAMAILDVCGDESRDVVFRLTTGELTKPERRGHEERESHRLVLTGPRLSAATGMLLIQEAADLAANYTAPAVYDVSLSPGTYRVVVGQYHAPARAEHDVVVQLVPDASKPAQLSDKRAAGRTAVDPAVRRPARR